MSADFKVDPKDASKEFPKVPIAWSWNLRPLLAEASDVDGVGPDAVREAARERWLKQGTGTLAHPLTGHNLVLQYARNTEPVMTTICGPGGYDTWQHGEPGTEGRGRGLYMGTEITFHAPMPGTAFGEIRHHLDGIYGVKGSAFVRHVSELWSADGATHYQDVKIMCRVAGMAPEGVERPPKNPVEVPDRDPDSVVEHQLAGKRLVFRWACASEDPNLRHIDDSDPRAHGPCAISIVTHDILREYAGDDVARLRGIRVPAFLRPFYQEDDLEVSLWKVDDETIVARLIRPKIEGADRHVFDLEVRIAN